MKPWVIYGLADPQSKEVRYVGFTSQNPPRKRFWFHCTESIKTATHLGAWLRQLAVRPDFVILQHGVGEGWQDAEREWIKLLSGNLCNHSAGGKGTSLMQPNGAEIRAKKSVAMIANWAANPHRRITKGAETARRMENPQERAAASERASTYLKRRWSDPEERARGLKGILDPDRRAAHSARMKAKWADPEYVAMQSVARGWK